jgi:hypothetical protein
MLFAQAEEIYAKSSRPITPMAYANDANGCPVPYVAPPGHPLHHAVQRAERVLAIQEYARQASHLAEAGRQTRPGRGARREAPAVAGLQLIGSDQDGWRTRTFWEHDGPVLLPAADEVQVADEVRPWADLAAHLTVAADLVPIRWTATHWPQR